MMRERFSRFLADQRGAAALEFAMIALPLVLLTIGVVEVGRAIFTQQSLSYAIDHAARRLYIDAGVDLEVLSQEIATESFLIDPAKLTTRLGSVSLPDGSTAFGIVELQIDYTFESIVADWVFDMIPMNFTRTIVVEN